MNRNGSGRGRPGPMRIYVVRHGDAEPAAVGAADAGRRLTAKGRRQSARVGGALRVLDAVPALVLTSPLPRARQTAELAVAAMAGKRRRPPIRVLDRLAPGAYAGDVLDAIPAGAPSVMLVGHQPTLGALVGALIGGMHAPPIDLSTGSVACLEAPGAPQPGGAALEYLLRRSVIAAIAGKRVKESP